MTLFTLLIVMALERVVTKSKSWHITTISNQYFSVFGLMTQNNKDSKRNDSEGLFSFLSIVPEPALMILLAAIPTIIVYLLVELLPGFFVFLLYLLVLWVCLGCPVTRNTYKRYLQAAKREDFEACALYSEKFGNQGGDLSNVGKQLVLVNYRQYASVILFFVVLGLPGVVFYSVAKEWFFVRKRQHDALNQIADETSENPNTADNGESNQTPFNLSANEEVICEDSKRLADNKANESQARSQHVSEAQTESIKSKVAESSVFEKASSTMLVLDWLPARFTALGYLLVGHFSKGLPVWLASLGDIKKNAYDVLASVAKASEDLPEDQNNYFDEPLQMVKLVKRNIVFLLMLISALTLTGAIT